MGGVIPPFCIRLLDAVFNSSQAPLDRLSLVLWESWGQCRSMTVTGQCQSHNKCMKQLYNPPPPLPCPWLLTSLNQETYKRTAQKIFRSPPRICSFFFALIGKPGVPNCCIGIKVNPMQSSSRCIDSRRFERTYRLHLQRSSSSRRP